MRRLWDCWSASRVSGIGRALVSSASLPAVSSWPPVSAGALTTAARFSRFSSFKEEGYYRLTSLKDIIIDECVYDMRMVRGSGPGGQGTNSSSNKAEVHVDMVLLSAYFDEDIIAALRRNEAGKALTANGATLIAACHEHRSGFRNKEACLERIKEMIRKASWVPAIVADPIERPTHVVTQKKMERRARSNRHRMQRSARKGQW